MVNSHIVKQEGVQWFILHYLQLWFEISVNHEGLLHQLVVPHQFCCLALHETV